MPNKNLDGIKKLKGEDFKKSRKIVLDVIGEKDKLNQGEAKAGARAVRPKQAAHASRRIDGLSTISKKVEPKIKKKPSKEEAGIIKSSQINRIDFFIKQNKKKRQQKESISSISRRKEKATMQKDKEKEREKAVIVKRGEEVKKQEQAQKEKRKIEKKKSYKDIINSIKDKTGKCFNQIIRFIKFFKKISARTILILVAVVVLSYFGFSISIINFSIDNNFTRIITKYLPVPALITEIGIIKYYDYKDAKSHAENYLSNHSSLPLEEEIVKESRESLVKEAIVKRLARKYNIEITESEIEQAYKKVVEQLPSQDSERELMGIYYNLGRDRYSERVIKPQLIKEKIVSSDIFNQEINKIALSRIKKIEQTLIRGKDFDQTAQKYGDEYSEGKYYTDDEIISQFGQLKPGLINGQASDIIITPAGYYLVYRYDKKENLLGLKYVFIRTITLDDYLDKEAKKIKVWSLVD